MKSECPIPTFASYIKYNEYKFFSRKSQDDFATFMANYEQLKAEMEEDIYKIYSRAQLSVLDLLSVSNLANEDVEQILNSSLETDSPEDLYKAIKKLVKKIAEDLANLDEVNEIIEDDVSMDFDLNYVKEEVRETVDLLKMDAKPLVIKFTHKMDSPQSPKIKDNESVDQFYCDGCEKTLASARKFYIHKKIRGCGNLDGIDFDCEECAEKPKFYTFSELRKHREENHLRGKEWDPEKYVNCPDCGKTVTKAYYLSSHKQWHLNEGLTTQCPECGKVVSKNGFRKHIDEHKRNQSGDMYFCDICPYKANAKYKVNSHKKVIHGPKAYTCDLCGTMFKVKATMDNHMLTKHRDSENATTYQCEMCEYTTKSEVSLNSHIQFRHREGKRICSFCNFETLDSDKLSSHFRTEHGIATDLTPKKSNNEKIYKCTQCDYSARSPQALRIHVKVKHVGTRFKCEQCDYTSTTKNQLRIHNNSKHLGVKYPCDFCPRHFSTQGSRRHHHVNQHPDQYIVYSCHLCSYRTDNKDLLQRHISGKYGKHNS